MIDKTPNNAMAVPKLEKVVVGVGIGKIKDDKKMIDQTLDIIEKITGQKPVITKAKKAISSFKLQKGQPVGLKVTLRRKKLEDFLSRLINAALPAIRDFRGVPLGKIDSSGNLNLGIKEAAIFPEVGFDSPAASIGLQITIVPTTRDREKAISLYRFLGIPIQKEENGS